MTLEETKLFNASRKCLINLLMSFILKLLLDLRAESGVSLLFVSHDLAVVETLCDSVLVLEGGEVREAGSCAEVFKNPQHAYTQALLASVL